MRLTSITISNIRSFKYEPGLQSKIEFSGDKLNLIIGPNGAGKSNLMEIVIRLFSDIYNHDYINNNDDLNQLIATRKGGDRFTSLAYVPPTFTKHRDSKHMPSTIRVEVLLDEADIHNLNILKANMTVLKNINDAFFQDDNEDVNSYAKIFEHLDEVPTAPTAYEITISDEESLNTANLHYKEVGEVNIAARYLKAYQMIKNSIHRHNDLLLPEQFIKLMNSNTPDIGYQQTLDMFGINPQSSKPIDNFLPLLQILSVQERITDIVFDYNGFENPMPGNNSRFTSERRYERALLQKSMLGSMNTSQSTTFEGIKASLLKSSYELLETKLSKTEVIKSINDRDTLLKRLNDYLDWFQLKITLLEFEPARAYIKVGIIDGGNSAQMADLSSGQKALINIASSIAIGKQSGSLVIIDEIENHLHPSIQSKLRDVLHATSSLGTQVIAITHSSIFVNTDTLNNTTRVFLEDGGSKTKKCSSVINGRNTKTLEVVLNFENGSRIFFTSRVLLVEGSSDELFTKAYIKRYFSNLDGEVLSGHGDRQTLLAWKEIIEKFGVEVSILNDLDQAAVLMSPRPTPINTVPNTSTNKANYEPADYAEMLSIIEQQKEQNTFILKEGAIEEYYESTIGKTKKQKVNRVYDFISSDDWTRIRYDDELQGIFKSMFNIS